MSVDNQVLAVFESYCSEYSNRSVEGVLALFEQSPELLVIGSGDDEVRFGVEALREQVERDFSQAEAISVSTDWRHACVYGDFAWLAVVGRIHATVEGETLTMRGRFSGALRRQGGIWRFTMLHFAVPYGAQHEGQSWP